MCRGYELAATHSRDKAMLQNSESYLSLGSFQKSLKLKLQTCGAHSRCRPKFTYTTHTSRLAVCKLFKLPQVAAELSLAPPKDCSRWSSACRMHGSRTSALSAAHGRGLATAAVLARMTSST